MFQEYSLDGINTSYLYFLISWEMKKYAKGRKCKAQETWQVLAAQGNKVQIVCVNSYMFAIC